MYMGNGGFSLMDINEHKVKNSNANTFEDSVVGKADVNVKDAAFNLFSLSGRVEDYLLYKKIERMTDNGQN